MRVGRNGPSKLLGTMPKNDAENCARYMKMATARLRKNPLRVQRGIWRPPLPEGGMHVRSLRDLVANALQYFLLQPGHLNLGYSEPGCHFRLGLVAVVPEIDDQTLPVG